MTEFSIKDWYKAGRGKRSENLAKKYYYDKFSRMATNIYKLKLPFNLDGNLVEKYLWTEGSAMCVKHPIVGWCVCKAQPTAWDFNGMSKKFRPVFDQNYTGVDLSNYEFSIDDPECVIFYDTCDPEIKRNIALFLIDDIVDVRETIRQQIFNQKTPLMAVTGNTKTRSKVKASIIDIAQNTNVLFLDEDIGNTIKPLNLNAPFNIEKLHAHRIYLENEIMMYLGIDSTDAPMKKERMLVDEVEGNDEILNYLLADGLKARQKAIDKFVAMGEIASVEIQDIIRPIMEFEEGVEYDNRDDE